MFNSIYQEEIKQIVPFDRKEKFLNEEKDWEILIEDNSQIGIKRHWFKQNQVGHLPQEPSQVTYYH